MYLHGPFHSGQNPRSGRVPTPLLLFAPISFRTNFGPRQRVATRAPESVPSLRARSSASRIEPQSRAPQPLALCLLPCSSATSTKRTGPARVTKMSKTPKTCPRFGDVPNPRMYFSGHKRSFGINLQGICDADLRFFVITTHCPGSVNDYFAFCHNQQLMNHLSRIPFPYYILGDPAYPLLRSLITPFSDFVGNREKDAFNFFILNLAS